MPEKPIQSQVKRCIPGWFLGILTIPIIIGLLYFGRVLFIPLAIAFLLFILTTAFVEWIDSAEIRGRSLPHWLARIIGVAVVFFGFAILAVILSNEIDNVVNSIPFYANRFQEMMSSIQSLLGKDFVGTIERSIAGIDVSAWLKGFAAGASSSLATFVLIMLYVAFLFTERQSFAEKLSLIANNETNGISINKLLQNISHGVKQYVWINALTSAMSAMVAFIVFRLVGLDFAATLALIIFISGFIPNIGAFIGISLPSLLALLQFDSWTPFLIVLLVYGAADQIIANFIQPSMQGKSLNLSTFMVMIGLSFWGAIWGGIGAFLAVPMMVILMIICSEIPFLRPIAILLSGDGKIITSD